MNGNKITVVVLTLSSLVLAGALYYEKWTTDVAMDVFNSFEVVAKGDRIRNYQLIQRHIESGDLEAAVKRLALITNLELDGVRSMAESGHFSEQVERTAKATLYKAENQAWEEPISPDVEAPGN